MKQLIQLLFFIVTSNTVFSQTYQNLKVKEEFDLYNSIIVNGISPCSISPNNDEDDFGDGMSKILDAYITMYKTTDDKAYLYKLVIQSLCMMENRHDYAGINSEPRWSFDSQM